MSVPTVSSVVVERFVTFARCSGGGWSALINMYDLRGRAARKTDSCHHSVLYYS